MYKTLFWNTVITRFLLLTLVWGATGNVLYIASVWLWAINPEGGAWQAFQVTLSLAIGAWLITQCIKSYIELWNEAHRLMRRITRRFQEGYLRQVHEAVNDFRSGSDVIRCGIVSQTLLEHQMLMGPDIKPFVNAQIDCIQELCSEISSEVIHRRVHDEITNKIKTVELKDL